MHTLALAVTNRCPLRCDFCCVPPGPGDLDDKVAHEIIDETIRNHLFNNVGFTGGEPLIRYEMVCNLGRKLADAEIRWGVTTGCGWATSLSKVDKVSNALSDSGIGDITVSVDNSHLIGKHAEFVSYFLDRLVDLGVPTRISCTSNNEELKVPISYPESTLVSVQYFYVAPVGFAKNLKVRKNNFDFSKSVCPMSEGLTLSVWPSGEVFPCCSTYIVNKEKAMVIGNVYESSISQILKAAIDDRLLLTIRNVGFSGLAILAPSTDAWKEAMSSTTIDVCHMCSKLAASGGFKDFRKELNSLE